MRGCVGGLPARRAVVLTLWGLAACARREPEAARDAPDAAPVEDAEPDARDPDAEAQQQRATALSAARAALDAGTWTTELYAAATRTSVMSAPAWPEDADAATTGPTNPALYRLGYLRHGSHAPAMGEPVPNEACADGWYALLAGGFVCGKYASVDPKAPAVRFAANPPDIASPMPYRYGFATANDTPVYRRVLSLADRRKYEPWLSAPGAPTRAPDAGTLLLPTEAASGDDNPYDSAAEPPADKPPTVKTRDAGARDAGLVKLGDLRGRGVLARKMMRGFYVALDRPFSAAKARWWRTAEGFAVPAERIALQGAAPTFHGSWVERASSDDAAAPPQGTGAAALVRSEYAARWTKNDKGKWVFGKPLAKWTAIELSGEPLINDGVQLQETTAGFFVRIADLKLAAPQRPPDLRTSEKWIDVDLAQQMLIAFEGEHPVYGTLISSGRRSPWDLPHDHPTPTGTYRIYEKHLTATMDGDVAADGPYSIQDVPWVMYFMGSYALHGAFWHDQFGTPRSHGCVNLSPTDARALFFWAEPALPTGWHGVFQTALAEGTRVVIHDAAQPVKK